MMASRRPELGKWLLWKWFYNDRTFRQYLPHTVKFGKAALSQMLSQHHSVYVKPVAGARGKNIVRVSKESDHYLVHVENRMPMTLRSESEVAKWLMRHAAGRMYIVQQDVKLAKIAGRPFDIRVMMQKDAHGKWLCTGLCAKVAGPHSAVTNVARSRGRVVTVEQALKEGLGWSQSAIHSMEDRLRELGHATCRRLEQYQPYAEIGVDVGIDNQGKIWLLEQNTGPSHALFRHLSDQSAYRLIQRTWRERVAARRVKRSSGPASDRSL